MSFGPAKRRPRSGLSTVRLGVLLLCLAGAGAAVLLWPSRAPVLGWVEASFPRSRPASGLPSPGRIPLPSRIASERKPSGSATGRALAFPELPPESLPPVCSSSTRGKDPRTSTVDKAPGNPSASSRPCTFAPALPVAIRAIRESRALRARCCLTVSQGVPATLSCSFLPAPRLGLSRTTTCAETVVHEYVIHCGLAKLLTNEEKERFLERVAEHVPHSRLRGWFGDPHVEAYYRHRHGVGPDLVTPAGYVDISSTNPFVTHRERALGYVEEAFAAFVDGDLASEVPQQRSPRAEFEIRVHMVADMLLAVAEGKEELPTLVAVVESL